MTKLWRHRVTDRFCRIHITVARSSQGRRSCVAVAASSLSQSQLWIRIKHDNACICCWPPCCCGCESKGGRACCRGAVQQSIVPSAGTTAANLPHAADAVQDGTDRQTDTVSLHRTCVPPAYCASTANKNNNHGTDLHNILISFICQFPKDGPKYVRGKKAAKVRKVHFVVICGTLSFHSQL